MKIKTGIDLIELATFKDKLNDPEFVRRVFLENELKKNSKPEQLAGIFALKESFFKATQAKIIRWNEIEVIKISGKPTFNFLNGTIDSKILSYDCSISHDGDYVVAAVVLLVK